MFVDCVCVLRFSWLGMLGAGAVHKSQFVSPSLHTPVSGPHDLKLEKLPLLLVWPLTAAFLHAGT